MKLPEATEEPHFEKTSFRVKGKIFATAVFSEDRSTVKLPKESIEAFVQVGEGNIYPVPNAWGKMGWTHLRISTISPELANDAVLASYCEVAPKKLAREVGWEE